MTNYPYLNNKNFLKRFDLETFQEQYVKITVLDFKTEKPIAHIEGKSTGGSVNISGTSNMRRTANCTVMVDPYGIQPIGQKTYVDYSNITEVDNLLSMNKKVRIETGFINSLAYFGEGYYPDYDVIWFPLGTYVIKAGSVSKNNSGINISLTLNDKCALLNGDMGGIIPAATVLSETEHINPSSTAKVVEKLLIKDIIRYLVIDFGGELPENVIISDIPDEIVKVMKWSGSENVFLILDEAKKRLETTLPEGDVEYQTYHYGQDVGYMKEPFTYPGKLECSVGDNVAALLDKVKTTLGNFEWFYDIWGKFHFQEIRNYVNGRTAQNILETQESDYFNYSSPALVEYVFDNNKLVSSISSNPQFANIKNDFLVWGTTKTAAGADKPIRYHLVFDQKPQVRTVPMLAYVYKDFNGKNQVIPLIEGQTFYRNLPSLDSPRDYYYYHSLSETLWYWDDTLDTPGFRTMDPDLDGKIYYLKPSDWRSELYFQGLENSKETFINNYYAAELNSEFPKLYNVLATDCNKVITGSSGIMAPLYEGDYYPEEDRPVASYEYWLDFLEGDSGIGRNISSFSVDNIGRRVKVLSDNNSNCLFPVVVPPYIYILADGTLRSDEVGYFNGYETIQVDEDVFNKLILGGSQSSAYDKVKELLYLHNTYNESISLSITPIYHLDANVRIKIADNDIAVNGDYMISSISLPLTPNGTSNISATKCVDKTF